MNNTYCAVFLGVWTVIAIVAVRFYLVERARRLRVEDVNAVLRSSERCLAQRCRNQCNEERMARADRAVLMEGAADELKMAREALLKAEAEAASLRHEMGELRESARNVSDRYQALKPLVAEVDDMVTWAERQTAQTYVATATPKERLLHWVRRMVSDELADLREKLAKCQADLRAEKGLVGHG